MQALSSDHQKIIYALHGFLGRSTDWRDVFKAIKSHYQVVCPSYFSDENFSHLKLNHFIEDMKNHTINYLHSKKIFVGYSLGGRIGLHLLESYPDLFDHYIFISTHSGLSQAADKKMRLASDQKWIEILHNSLWEDFLTQWNAQTVLKNSCAVERLETHYKKDRLISALSDYSLGQQKDYSDLIKKYQDRITWIVGDQDAKFLNLAEDLKQKNILLDYKRIESGHRILIDAPERLSKIMESVLEFL